MSTAAVSERPQAARRRSGDAPTPEFDMDQFSFQQPIELPPTTHTLSGRYSHGIDYKSEARIREQAREQKLSYYLRAVSRLGEISEYTAVRAWRLWRSLRGMPQAQLRVPDACPGPNGELLFTWDAGQHYLELEIFPNGTAELFYRNRETGEMWEYDEPFDDVVEEEVKAKLTLFSII